MADSRKPRGKFLTAIDELFDLAIAYAKAIVIMLVINIAVVTVGMLVLDMGWWSPLIALGIALVDVLPVLGSGTVFVPWIIYCIFTDKSEMALGLGIIFVIMLVLRFVLEPIICGKKIGLSPLIAIAAALVGLLFLGPFGLIVGPIAASVVNVFYRFFSRRETVMNGRKKK